MFKKILLSMVLLCVGFASSFAQETLTVYDGGNTSNYVPIYGLYVDDFVKVELVMNADQLESITGATIEGLTWYLSTPAATSWGTATFQIFMKEVSEPTISNFTGLTDATVVYTGTLDGTQSEMVINFDTPYTYEGGNLLIGVYVIQEGTYKSATFSGTTVSGASVYATNGSSLDNITTGSQRDFVPKTTFSYVPGSGVIYYKPTNVQASNITPNSADITWTPGSDETSWNVEYKKSADEEWTAAGAVSTPAITLDVLENGTVYDVRVQADYGDGNLSSWASASFTTTICDAANMGEIAYTLTDTYGDGWNGNKLQIVYHNTGAVIAELTMTSGSLLEGTVNLCYGEDYDLVWVSGNYGYETGFTVVDPEGEIIYEFHGTGASSGPVPTAGVLTTFQITKDQFPKPKHLEVSDITGASAVATWTGDAESYNLRYRTPAGFVKMYEESFEGDAVWNAIDSDGDGHNWTIIEPSQYSVSGVQLQAKDGDKCLFSQSYYDGAGLTPDNWVVSPQLNLDGTLEFWMADDGNYPEKIRVYASTTDSEIESFAAISEDIETAHLGAPNQWVKYEVDLSSFAGQEGYIAFRHYGTTDQDIVFIDAIAINGAAIPAGEWVVMEGVTSPTTMEPLTVGTTYEVQVQAVYADGNSEWTDLVEFTTLPADAMPTGLEVTAVAATTADVNWTGVQEAYNLRYRTPASADVKFFESFEEGLGNWTVIDSDGDGNNWVQFNPTTFSSGGFPAYDGNYGAMSRSWMSSALTPDNWLISPQVELGTTLRYYIVDDGSNYEETYRIYISTTDNNIESFVPLTDDMLSPNSADWTEVNIDLSAYAGQMGYIAFRQYNCTDRDFMIIDAVSILDNEVAAGEWVEVENVTAPYTITGLAPETTYEVEVQGIVDENTVTDWTAPVEFTTTESTVERGNVNGVGGVDMDDLTALINYMLDPVNTEINQANAAACNSLDSNEVNMDDLTALINFMMTGAWAD